MAWVKIAEHGKPAADIKTYKMPGVPRVGDHVRVDDGRFSTFIVTGVIWDVLPEMEHPGFDLEDAPAVYVYVKPTR